MAPARRLQFQLLLPAVYNFNSSCQTSTTSTAPTIMVPRPRHGTLMTPGPNVVLYCLHLFYKTLLYPSISESDPNCHSPIRPRQNVTPQVCPGQNVTPQFVPQTKCHSPIRPTLKSGTNSSQTNCHSPVRPTDKMSLPNSSRTKCHSPVRPTDKMSLPNSSHFKNPAPKMTRTINYPH